jgi:hypothetical protein
MGARSRGLGLEAKPSAKYCTVDEVLFSWQRQTRQSTGSYQYRDPRTGESGRGLFPPPNSVNALSTRLRCPQKHQLVKNEVVRLEAMRLPPPLLLLLVAAVLLAASW